nr:MAG TPA: hypothetical protein [Caudoviricetes sp.]
MPSVPPVRRCGWLLSVGLPHYTPAAFRLSVGLSVGLRWGYPMGGYFVRVAVKCNLE